MKRTTKYGMTYFEKGDYPLSLPEMQRWETLDSQLYALFSILGNGVISGWSLVASSGLAIVITPGLGHVSFVAVESDADTAVILTPSTLNYIYASLAADSYWTKNVVFYSALQENLNNNVLLLGTVTTDATSVTAIDTSGKTQLGFAALVTSAVKAHRHIGGSVNPSQINLATDVQGIINQQNLPPLDASLVQTGLLDPARLPLIDHVTGLSDQGVLTHSQLDDFVNTLALPDQTTMGEVSTTNLLQLILALKHVYPNIDQYLTNELAFIPGISPDSVIDILNTTANVNTVSHTISGTVSDGMQAYTHIWDTNPDFVANAANSTGIVVNGDAITLNTQNNILIIDGFSNINEWSVQVVDLSNVAATLSVASNVMSADVASQSVEVALQIKKDFDAQDWSGYNYLIFSINTNNVQHGDLFFYLVDAKAGIQNSYQVVLNRNCPTVNQDTLGNGWQEVTVDLTPYIRNNISELGFFVSTQDGWDTSKGFSFDLENIYLTTGNTYVTDGHFYLTYGSAFLYSFWRVRWNAYLPSDIEAAGLDFEVRCRWSNDPSFAGAVWTTFSTTSPFTIPMPVGVLAKYLQIDCYFLSSSSKTRAPLLTKVYLDFYAADIDNSFEYSNTNDWTSGYLFNVDTQTTPNSIQVQGVNEIGNIYYGSNGKVVQAGNASGNFSTISQLSGSMLPRSTHQVMNGLPSSFGLVTGVVRGNNGNIILSDIDNDRVVEIDPNGSLIRGFGGSFLTAPQDVYDGSTLVSNNNVISAINVLHSIYNPEEGALYIVCDETLENIYSNTASLNMENVFLKVGAQRIYLKDSKIELLGVDENKYNLWSQMLVSNALTTTVSNTVSSIVQNVNRFSFSSNVLKIIPLGADKTLLDYLVDQKAPAVTIVSPLELEQTTSNVTASFVTYNFELGTTFGEPAINVNLDNNSNTVVYTDTISFTNLTSGIHTMEVQLLQANGNVYSNIESVAVSHFIVEPDNYHMMTPHLHFNSPRPNQLCSSSPVSIDFSMDNFAIVPNGQHIQYVVDSNPPVDWYSTDPIILSGLLAGKHIVYIYPVDQVGHHLYYTFGEGNIEFVVGLNSNAITTLCVNNNAIYSQGQTASCPAIRMPIDVANMYLRNIYAPVDVKIELADNNTQTFLITKLRSPSSPDYLGGTENVNEIVNRITLEAAKLASANASAATLSALTGSIVLNNSLASISTGNLVFDTGFLDGHSIIEIDMGGNVIFSNNDAKISPTKEFAREILGSGSKLGTNEVLIADAYNQRAIVSVTNTATRTSSITFEYNSDRYVSDAQIALQDEIVIEVSNTAASPSTVVLEAGQTVTWDNVSNISVYVYSGTLGYGELPDYSNSNGKIQSGEILAGNVYSQTFNSVDSINWTVSPLLVGNVAATGNITILPQRVSSRDNYYLVENDMLESPFSSRIIKVNCYGEVLYSFGAGLLVKPRDVRPMLNGRILIST